MNNVVDNEGKLDLVLASSSPRRKELLTRMGFQFEVYKVEFDETVEPHWKTVDVARKLSEGKNYACRKKLLLPIIITADTVVMKDGNILGKPRDKEEALQMLSNLSDCTHEVITGVTISSEVKMVSFSDTTEVKFAKLEQEELEYYVDQFSPMDKAGSYGIQEWIGIVGVEYLKGSFYNVMGLPTHRIYRVLTQDFNLSAVFAHK